MRKLVTAALVLAGLEIASGCGGDESNSKGSRRQSDAEASRQRAEDRKAAAAVRRELRTVYRTAPWYDNVKGVTVIAGDVTVKTDLFRDADAQGPANAICTAIENPVTADELAGVTGARVLGSDGGVVRRC